jgi:hypothetical protein
MKESAAMLEIRKIRDENSLRRLSQTPEERKQEAKKTMDWFLNAIGKPVNIVTKPK